MASVAASKWVASPRSIRCGSPHDGHRGRSPPKIGRHAVECRPGGRFQNIPDEVVGGWWWEVAWWPSRRKLSNQIESVSNRFHLKMTIFGQYKHMNTLNMSSEGDLSILKIALLEPLEK